MYQRILIDASVFRAYDIRGIIGEGLNENAYYTLGCVLAERLQQLNRDTAYVARDGRLTSPVLARALTAGLLESGIHVFDLGEVTTPVMYYATHAHEHDCGFMITGSHNAAEYNGLKMVLCRKTLVQADIHLLYTMINDKPTPRTPGTYHQYNMLPEYTSAITTRITLDRPLKIVVDCGSGIAGPIVPDVLRLLGCEVITLYCQVDGRFPHHHPDPSVEDNLLDLKQAVLAHQADMGLGFDGDGDRLGVITEMGDIIWPDRLLMYYAYHLLQSNPQARIVYDVKCSSHLPRLIEARGGQGIMSPTGHSIVKSLMKEKQAALAGEMSGHIFFQDRWYGFDDALYSACRLLELLSRDPLSVSQQFSDIPSSISTSEIKIPMPDAIKFDFMLKFMASATFHDAKLITIDGIRAEFPYGFGLLRASNTSPYLIARFEAIDAEHLEKIKIMFKQVFQNVNPNLEVPF